MSTLALDRRSLLKAGGALVIGFSFASAAYARQFGPPPGAPDPEAIDSWIAIHADNTATILIGFVELGQGASTALPMVAAEELDLGLDQVKTIAHQTGVTPAQGGTYSSAAIARGRPQVQRAAAEARQALLNMASERLDAPVAELTVERGVVSVGGDASRSVTYGELIGDRRFALAFTGTAPVKDPSSYQLTGKPAVRRDIEAKVRGTYDYVQHVRLPGMLHGRVVRPRGQRAFAAGAKAVSVDSRSIAHIPGARVLARGDFLGVVAPKEWDAVRAARELAVVWDETSTLPGSDGLYDYMKNGPTTDVVVREAGDVGAGLAGAAKTVEFEARTPYQAHVPFAPNCAVASVTADGAEVWAPSQDIYALRGTLSPLLGLPAERIKVIYAESAGTFGHSCYDDVAQAAAILSQLAAAPVRLQFMRADEHGWDPHGGPQIGIARVGADAQGKIVAYEYECWQHNWSQIETSAQLATGAAAVEWPRGAPQGVNPLICGGMYAPANLKLVDHQISSLNLLRSAWLRSPLDLALMFVSEQAIDQLAYELEIDPYEFRRRNITDERWLGVLNAVAESSGWTTSQRRAASSIGRGDVVRGRGIGLGTHLASWGGAVAEVGVNRATGVVTILKLWGAIDAGFAVNPGAIEAQIEGQMVQTVGRMLYEEITFDRVGVTSLDWASYPIARFADLPEITPIVVQRIDQPSSGAGEEAMAAAAAAIGNAFFDATGRRMTTFPMTPERVKAALA
jgi:CO/xanthine dehydrogenase Mo-binding subunit